MDNYSVEKNGAVVAMRIFLEDSRKPMAELAFAYGGTATIDWTNVAEREKYKEGINGYTLIYDERPKADFSSWVKPMHG